MIGSVIGWINHEFVHQNDVSILKVIFFLGRIHHNLGWLINANYNLGYASWHTSKLGWLTKQMIKHINAWFNTLLS